MRRIEAVEHGARSACLDTRAVHQAERGHIGRAAALETRSDIQKVEAVEAVVHPHHHHDHRRPPPVGVVAAETAMVAGAAVKGAIVAEEMRDIREAEMIAASRAAYPPGVGYPPTQTNVYIQPGGGYPPGSAYPPGAYPPGAYPPPPGERYPPGAPGYYPPTTGYPGYPPY